jgi:hypothetical protein
MDFLEERVEKLLKAQFEAGSTIKGTKIFGNGFSGNEVSPYM